MKNKLGVMIFSLAFGYTAHGVTGTEGHGGDLLRKLFADARMSAGNKAQQIRSCSFASNVPSNIRDWILSHRPDYASDILRSQQVWITDPQPTCAWTQTKDAFDITLSFEACRPLVSTEANAAHILFHESVHHFGISDENFAEAVANAMDTATVNITCPKDPHDPFNPDACPGSAITSKEFLEYFNAGGDRVKISQSTSIVLRHRKCLGNTEDLCTDWAYKSKGIVDLWLGIDQMQPWARVETNMSPYLQGYGSISGLTKDSVSLNLGYLFGWEPSNYIDFKGVGRFTKGCLVQRTRVDMENEAGFLLQF